jgi:hypothetical protein
MHERNFDSSVIKRMLGPGESPLPTEVAQYFLGLRLSEWDHDRIAELSEKANEGRLSPPEHDELATYVLMNDFLTIMQSRARVSVKDQAPAA